MFLNGSLENFSVADILQLLSFSKQSGALYVSGKVSCTLYLDEGELYYAAAGPDSSLERALVAAGVSKHEWDAAVERGSADLRVGDALIERGADPAVVAEVVRRHVSDSLFELLRMPGEGTFDFRVAERHPWGPVHRIPVEGLVSETRTRVAEWEGVSELFSSPATSVSAASELPEDRVEVVFDGDAWAFLLSVVRRNGSTLAELAQAHGVTERVVAQALDPLARRGLVAVGDVIESPGDVELGGQNDDAPPLVESAEDLFSELRDDADWWSETAAEPPADPGRASGADATLLESTESTTLEGDDFTPLDSDELLLGLDEPLDDTGRDDEEPEASDAVIVSEAPEDASESDDNAGGFRTVALQELRDLAGTAPAQPASGGRTKAAPRASESPGEPAPPKVRALRRIITAVRGL